MDCFARPRGPAPPSTPGMSCSPWWVSAACISSWASYSFSCSSARSATDLLRRVPATRVFTREEPMVELWYAILVLILGLYVVLDGWAIGAGVLHYAVAPSDA